MDRTPTPFGSFGSGIVLHPTSAAPRHAGPYRMKRRTRFCARCAACLVVLLVPGITTAAIRLRTCLPLCTVPSSCRTTAACTLTLPAYHTCTLPPACLHHTSRLPAPVLIHPYLTLPVLLPPFSAYRSHLFWSGSQQRTAATTRWRATRGGFGRGVGVTRMPPLS